MNKDSMQEPEITAMGPAPAGWAAGKPESQGSRKPDHSRRLVLFTFEFPPGPGGIGNHAWNLARHLSERGWKLTVVTDSRRGYEEAEKSFDREQAFVIRRSHRNRGVVVGIIQRVLLFFRAVRESGGGTCVLVSGKFPLWMGALYSLLWPTRRFFAVAHGSEVNYHFGWKRLLTRFALGRYARVIAVSNYTKQLVHRVRPDARVDVIFNGYAPKQKVSMAKAETLPGDPPIITVGTVSFRKGQQNVIAALPVLAERWPDIRYYIVGTPLRQRDMESLAVKLNVAGRVVFTGAVDDERLLQMLSGSRLFYMLSAEQEDGDTEGFGIAILEANAMGIPAIASKDCGTADAVKDGYSGKLVDPHNPQEIAAATEAVLADYDSYAAHAKQWSEQFVWPKIADLYEQALQQ